MRSAGAFVLAAVALTWLFTLTPSAFLGTVLVACLAGSLVSEWRRR